MKISLLELGDVRCRLAETFGDFCSDFWQILQRVQTQHFVLFTLKLKVVMIKI